MRTARFSDSRGICLTIRMQTPPPRRQIPSLHVAPLGGIHPWMQPPRPPPQADPPGCGPPGGKPPLEAYPFGCRPPSRRETSLDANQTRGRHPFPLVNRMADASENITLRQTSFAGGNKINFLAITHQA